MTNRLHHSITMFAAALPVLAQALLLWHALVNTKPFKFMTDPPARAFAMTAVMGAIVAVIAAIAVPLLLRKSRQEYGPLIAVGIAVLIFAVSFWAATLSTVDSAATNGSHTLSQPDVDGISARTPSREENVAEARREFLRKLADIALVGLLTGGLASFALRSLIRRRALRRSSTRD